MHEAGDFLIIDSDIAGCLISYAYGSTHRDDVIIGMRREHYDTFGIRKCPFRTIGIIGIRLTSRPTCDSVLQIIEHPYVHIIRRTIDSQQLIESVLTVILVGEFQK